MNSTTSYTDLWHRVKPLVEKAQHGRPLPRPNADGWIGPLHSPLREDKHPSFGVLPASATSAGGYRDYARDEHGSMVDLARRLGIPVPQASPETVYDYHDEQGRLLFQAVRKPLQGSDKTFKQRRPRRPDESPGPNDDAQWVYSLRGLVRPLPLYRQCELLAADPSLPVFVTEGEKDTDRLRSNGLVATTNAMGAGKWRQEYAPLFRGRQVVILPDNDAPGCAHGQQVAGSLQDTAASVTVVELPGLPENGDVSDWLDMGHTVEELLALVAPAPPFLDSRLPSIKERDNRVIEKALGFRLTHLTDLMAEPEEHHSYVWDDTLPTGGISIVGAKPKVGKTTLGRTLTLATARGDPCLGRGTHQGTVLLFALEEKRAEIAAQFRRIAPGEELPIYVHTGAAPEHALTELAAALEKYKPVALAIVDPLQKFIRVKDVIDYAEVARAMEPLTNLARTTGTHIMCVHHLGKGGRSGGDDLLGSTAFFGAVDTLLLMRRHGQQRTIESIQRYGVDLPETVLQMDPDTGLITAAGSYTEVQARAASNALLTALADATLSEPDIKNKVGGNQTTTATMLRALVKAGTVVRIGEGKRNNPYLYRHKDTPPAEPDEQTAKDTAEQPTEPSQPLSEHTLEDEKSSITRLPLEL